MRLSPSAILTRAKPDDAGSGNPDPTMKPVGKADPATIRGENMPPFGGEDISPADGGRSPKATREEATREEAKREEAKREESTQDRARARDEGEG